MPRGLPKDLQKCSVAQIFNFKVANCLLWHYVYLTTSGKTGYISSWRLEGKTDYSDNYLVKYIRAGLLPRSD
jgi:hypothetical protein